MHILLFVLSYKYTGVLYEITLNELPTLTLNKFL